MKDTILGDNISRLLNIVKDKTGMDLSYCDSVLIIITNKIRLLIHIVQDFFCYFTPYNSGFFQKKLAFSYFLCYNILL